MPATTGFVCSETATMVNFVPCVFYHNKQKLGREKESLSTYKRRSISKTIKVLRNGTLPASLLPRTVGRERGREAGRPPCTHRRLLVQRLQHPVLQCLEIPRPLVLHSFLARLEKLQAERSREDKTEQFSTGGSAPSGWRCPVGTPGTPQLAARSQARACHPPLDLRKTGK